jgi:hypothetical protein
VPEEKGPKKKLKSLKRKPDFGNERQIKCTLAVLLKC